jgi:hypothetical protein
MAELYVWMAEPKRISFWTIALLLVAPPELAVPFLIGLMEP